MAKVNKVRCKFDSRRVKTTPYLLPCCKNAAKEGKSKKKRSENSDKNVWNAINCSVCLEYPHNAVLLLCSSYNKGCHPYMCATSQRFSNCLKQYKKAYKKTPSTESSGELDQEILCPLCRGQVQGWTVVGPARKYFNAKKRSCMLDKCVFRGTYKELRKHVKAKHPLARPREVDPALEEKWKKLENERERSDVISTIISSTPGAVVLGDYVLEPGYRGMYGAYDSDDSLDGGGFDFDFSDDDDHFVTRRGTVGGAYAVNRRMFHRVHVAGARRQGRRLREGVNRGR